MQISVKYFASLRELLGSPGTTLDVGDDISVNELWQSIISEHDVEFENVMMTVNHEYVKPEYRLQSGDEVAFFPPVTGG